MGKKIMSDKKNNLEQRTKYLKLGGKICLDIVVLLMVVRTVIFMNWILKQSSIDWQEGRAPDSSQYDWTLIVTAIGWVVLFFVFTYAQKKELHKTGDYSSAPYREPFFWWFYIRGRKKKQ